MNKGKSNKIEEHLEKQLNLMEQGVQAPSELKSEVFNTLDTLGLLGDIADLFTVKFSHSNAIILDAATNTGEENDERF